jgi:cytidylate kinase
MPVDPVQIIQALVGAQLTAKSDSYLPQGNVVTVSRSDGSGGDEVAQRLAQRLGIPYYDKQILEAIIEAAPDNRAAMERLDQQVSTVRDEVMRLIITGKNPIDEYRRHLINVILSIARRSGVILGRGAHLLLARHHVFRARIVGSLEQRALRISKQQNIPLNEANERIRRADAEHADFIRRVFNQALDDTTRFDLTINTDHITPDHAADLILFVMQRIGYPIPEQAPSSTLSTA